jgi:hypothetical protein
MVEKEAFIAYFDVVLQHLFRGNEGNQKNMPCLVFSWTRFEPVTFHI